MKPDTNNINAIVSTTEIWIKPRVEVIAVNDETLGSGIEPDKVIHFFMGT